MPIIESKSGPSPVEGGVAANSSARERAIAKLTQAQDTPVQNPTQVSPEEMSALQTPETKQESVQENTSEAPKEKTEEKTLSSQYAQLAKKERALRAQIQAFKQQQEQFKQSQTPQTQQIDTSRYIDREQLKNNTWQVLQDAGITYDTLTQQVVNQPDPVTQSITRLEAEVKQELKALRDAREADQKAAVEAQKNSYDQAVKQIHSEVKLLVNSDPNFETILSTNSTRDVVDLIERTYNEEGHIMSVEDAAREVEEYLVEEAIKLAKLKKISARLAPPTQKTESQEKTQQLQTKTLTNSMTASRPASVRERAIAAFKGTLK